MMEICGQTDFYKDLYERCIQMNDAPYSHGQWQLAFVYNCCVAAHKDLRPFFRKWGWLTPVEMEIHDYGTDTLSIKQHDIDILNRKIDALYLPNLTAAVEYITDENLSLYQKDETFISGKFLIDDKMQIQIKDSQGAVAFEVYNGNTLIGVSHHDTFKLSLPPTTVTEKLKVMAVLPDGRRIKCEQEFIK